LFVGDKRSLSDNLKQDAEGQEQGQARVRLTWEETSKLSSRGPTEAEEDQILKSLTVLAAVDSAAMAGVRAAHLVYVGEQHKGKV
jgi:hypothetical protein